MNDDEIFAQRLNSQLSRDVRVVATADAKKLRVEAEASRKRLEAMRAAAELAQAASVANMNRSTYQLADDARIGMINTVDTMLSAGVAAGIMGPRIVDVAARAAADQAGIDLPRDPSVDFLKAEAASILGSSAARGEERNLEKSAISRVNNAIVNEETRNDQIENAQARERMIEAGVPEIFANTAEFGSNVIDSAGNSIDNPTVLFDDVSGSAPTLLLGPMGRAAATPAQVAARATTLAARAAALEGGEAAVTNAIRQKAIEQLTLRNTLIGTGISEGASSFTEVGGNIQNASIEELAERFPEVNQKLAAGISEENIRADLAVRVGGSAALLTGATAAAAAKVIPNINVDPLGVGKAARRTGQNLIDVTGELVEEGAQSAAGQLSQNLAERYVGGNENQELMEGVGSAAGRGGIAGAATAGAVRAPSQVLSTTVDAAKAIGSPIVGALRSRAAAAAESETKAAELVERTEQTNREIKAADNLAAVDVSSLAPVVGETLAAVQSEVSDNTPADLGIVNQETGEKAVPRNRLEAHLAAVYELFQTPDLPQDRNMLLQAYVAKNAREMQEQIETVLIPALDAASTQEEKVRINEAINHLRVFTNSPEVVGIRERFMQFSEEDTKQIFDSLPDTVVPEGTVLPQASVAALDVLNELAVYAPEKISVAMADRGLAARSNMSAAQRARLELARAIAEKAETYEVDVEAISSRLGKDAKKVQKQILFDGFTEESKKKLGVSQHVANITSAMAEGRVGDAKKAMAFFGRWTRYAVDRAASAQGIALTRLAGNNDKEVPVTTKTIDPISGKLRETEFILFPNRAGSVGTVQLMGVDARKIVESFNALVEAFPELGQEKAYVMAQVNLLELMQAPAEQRQVEGRKIIANYWLGEATKNRFNLGVRRQPGQENIVEFFESDVPMLKQQLSPAVILPNGKPLTEAQLEMVINGDDITPLLDGKTTRETRKINEESKKAEAAVAPAKEVEEKPAPKKSKRKTKKPKSLLERVAARGLDRDSWKKEAGIDPADFTRRAGGFYIFRKRDRRNPDVPVGMTPDEFREWLQTNNFVAQDSEDRPADFSISDAIDMFDRAFRGGQEIFSFDDQDAAVEAQAERRRQDEEDQANQSIEQEDSTITLDDILNNPNQVNFNDPTRADQAEIDRALAMTQDEYFAEIVPKDAKETSAPSAAYLEEELNDLEVPSRAEEINSLVLPNGEIVRVMADGNTLYAVVSQEDAPDLIVGRLMFSPNAGVEFSVRPGEDYQGKGIGKMLMRELLIRKPFAPAGSLTEAAKAVRMSVLNEMRTKKPKALAERFKGLLQNSGVISDTDTPAQKREKQNRILNSFRPSQTNEGFFSRISNSLNNAVALIDEGKISELFPDRFKSMLVPEQDMLSLGKLFKLDIPDVVEHMNKRLRYMMSLPVKQNSKQTNMQLILSGTRPDYWNFQNMGSVHAAVFNEDGTVRYQEELAAAVAFATFRWVIDNLDRPTKKSSDDMAKIRSRWPNGMTPEMESAYNSEHEFADAPRKIASDAMRLLGIELNPDAPKNHYQESFGALVNEAIASMNTLGFLKLHEVEVPKGLTPSGFASSLTFVTFPDDSNYRTAQIAPPSKIMVSLVADHFAEDQPSIGAPPKQVPNKVKGTRQRTSDVQRQVAEKYNKTAFKLNKELADFVSKIGIAAFRRIRGYSEQDLSKLNKQHAIAIKGLNQSIEYEDRAINELMDLLDAYAQNKNMSVEDVEVFWNHFYSPNARVMARGVAPQNHKTMREMMLISQLPIKKGDKAAEDRLFAAMSQALGLAKLEHTASTEIAANKLRAIIDAPVVVAVLDSINGSGSDFEAAVAALNESKVAKVNSTKAVHALLTLARYQQTEAGQDFTYGLTVEIDGVNNGPHNAHVQFMSEKITTEDLHQLEQGGVFVGQGDVTLSSKEGKLGDRYKDTARVAFEIFYKARQKLAESKASQVVLGAHESLETLLSVLGLGEQNEQGVLGAFTRAFGKEVLVPVNYMSGQRSVSEKIADTLENGLYERISDFLLSSPETREATATEIDNYVWELNRIIAYKMDRKDPVKQAGPGGFINLTADPESLRNFKLPAALREVLSNNVDATVGKAAYDAAVINMGVSRPGLETVVEATKLLTTLVQVRFDALYKETREKLIAAGELTEYDALSEAQETALFEQLKTILPNVSLSQTDQGNPDEGLSVATKGRGTTFQFRSTSNASGVRDREVQTFDKKYSTKVVRADIADPGVAMAPMLVIASGDATMVHLLTMMKDMAPHLGIWDGLDTHPEYMEKLGEQANQAAFESWNNTVLYDVADMLSRIDNETSLGVTKEDAAKVLSQYYKRDPKTLGKKLEAANGDYREVLFNELYMLGTIIENMAINREANWAAMKELGISTDQMAGANKAYFYPGTEDSMTPEQVVAYVNERASEIVGNRIETTADRMSGTNELVSEIPTGRDVEELSFDRVVELMERSGVLKGKINKYVFSIIKHVLPQNLTVTFGKPKAVAKAFSERHPEMTAMQTRGYYVSGSTPRLYVADLSPVTMLHELVHAATEGLIYQYYAENGKISGAQKEAVAQLEKLARAFLDLQPMGSELDMSTMLSVQRVMKGLLDANHMHEFVSEFLAYTLTDRRIQTTLSKTTLPEALQKLKTWAIDAVRKLLGLPKNQPMNDWLTEILGQTMNLVKHAKPSNLVSSGVVLKHSAAIEANPRLSQLNNMLEKVFGRVLAQDELDAFELDLEAQRIALDFRNAGFNMTDEETAVFEKIQAVFASGLQLDTEVFRAMQRVYDSVMPQLSWKDFLDDPLDTSNTAIDIAVGRFKALNTTTEDKLKRSNHLANFVALAMVNENFRTKLESISVPKLSPKSSGSTIDDVLRKGMTNVINTAGSMYTMKSLKNLNQRATLDALLNRMIQISNQQAQREETLKQISILEKAESKVTDVMKSSADKLSEVAQPLVKSKNAWKRTTGVLLGLLSAGLSEDRANAWKESMISVLNEYNGSKTLREVMGEIIGVSESSYPIALLLNQSKQHVSTLRQRLREETPIQVKEWFKEKLPKKTWQRMTTLVGFTDFASIWNSMDQAKVLAGLTSDDALADLISEQENLLDNNKELYLEAVDDLAHWMVNKSNKSKRFLYRNATSMAYLYGMNGLSLSGAEASIPVLDKLISLRALQKLSSDQRLELHKLLTTEPEGMTKVLNSLAQLQKIEWNKGDSFNQWKGYVPTSEDPRKQIRLATAAQGKELLRTGWKRLASYNGDSEDTAGGLAYYVSSVGNEVTYNQGALQLVVNTVGGTMAGTGQSLSRFTGLVIEGNQVGKITNAKAAALTTTDKNNLIPIFGEDVNKDVVVLGYERTLDEAIVKRTVRGDEDLAVSLGIWMGRQAEEETAAMFNQKVGDALLESWKEAKIQLKDNEYVAINLSKDPIDKGTWEAIPEHTREMLLNKFGGKVMVSRDARNNAFGYRNASVRDVFTGYSGLNPDAKKAIREIALGLMGKNAYTWLATAEDLLKDVVSTAKDLIVVRSGVVALGNLISNQFQLLAMGVPLTELPKQFKIAKEIETYLRNEHRIARITAELRAETDPVKLGRLEREAKMLDDNNKRMSIADLIAAGELPTIAEGLSETDEYTLASDAAAWLQKRTENLPKGLTDIGRYALITRDTALYQGLNRMIQFGDLMAKQLMFEQLQREGQTKEQALREVQDTFVNYNILPGRTRSALENMGVLWFWNYKLRIQRIFFRTVRKHPLRALIHMGGADLAGADSMFSTLPINTDLTYTMGPGQLARAHELHMWAQMTR